MWTTSYPVFLTGSGRGCVPKTSIALHGFRSADKWVFHYCVIYEQE
jgi:hypothetical protein